MSFKLHGKFIFTKYPLVNNRHEYISVIWTDNTSFASDIRNKH